MRRTFSSGSLLLAGGFACLVAVCSVASFPPSRISAAPVIDTRELNVSPEVEAMINRSCRDCHSDHTRWPWYSYVAPVSWFVQQDVKHGRAHLNFSHWSDYDFEQRRKLLADIASVVKNHEMPLTQYVSMHPAAALSDLDRDTLYQWARTERRRMKEQAPVAIQPTAQPIFEDPAQ